MKSASDFFMYLFAVLLFGFLFVIPVWMYYSFFLTPERSEVEFVVIEKQSQKGLFLGPRYQVITEDSDVGNYVSKKTFDSLEAGDTITGYRTSEYGFFTSMDQLYDGAILLFLIVALGGLFLVILASFIVSIPAVEQALANRPKKKDRNWFGIGILIIVLPLMLTYSSLFTANLYHKLVGVGQTEVEGYIVKRDYESKFRPQADYSTYELTIFFTDEKGESHRVRKGVTRTTFDKFTDISDIDLKYREKNPNDIFIKTESFDEIVMAIFNVYTAIYVLCLFVFYLLIRQLWPSKVAKE